MISKIFKLLLKKNKEILIGDYRSKILSNLIVKLILKYSKNSQKIKMIDYGSGYQPNVVYFIYEQLKFIYKKEISVECFDIYNPKDLNKLNINNDIIFNHIEKFDIKKNEYDFCLINDVLHHIGIEKTNDLKNLISKLQNRSKYVIIKDHFEYSYFSNLTLRLMDFLGNYFNNVNTPQKYFTKESFKKILDLSNSEVIEEIPEIKLYQSYFLFFSNPKLHFINVIKKLI